MTMRNLLMLATQAGLLLVLAACASAPSTTAMQASAPMVARSKAPGGVVVRASGGRETSNMTGAAIADADLKTAIEASLAAAGLFDGRDKVAATRYALQANIVQLSKPSFGASFTVDLEIAWTLVDTKLGTTLLRKSIQSSNTATMSDAVVGANRMRMAIEGAARKNIEAAIRELSALSY